MGESSAHAKARPGIAENAVGAFVTLFFEIEVEKQID